MVMLPEYVELRATLSTLTAVALRLAEKLSQRYRLWGKVGPADAGEATEIARARRPDVMARMVETMAHYSVVIDEHKRGPERLNDCTSLAYKRHWLIRYPHLVS